MHESWGVQGYYVPKNFNELRRSPQFRFNMERNKSFTNTIIRHAEGVPSPDQYTKDSEWPKPTQGRNSIDGAKKETFIEELMRKKKDFPGPSSYFSLKRSSIPGGGIPKGQKKGFLTEAEFHSTQSPGPFTYDGDVRLKALQTVFSPEIEDPEEIAELQNLFSAVEREIRKKEETR